MNNSQQNAGQTWSKAEDRILEAQFIDFNWSITRCARAHQRTELAILCRLQKLGIIHEDQVRIQPYWSSPDEQAQHNCITLDRERFRADTHSQRHSIYARIKAHVSGLMDLDFYVLVVECSHHDDLPLVEEYIKVYRLLEQQLVKKERQRLVYLKRTYRNTLTDLLVKQQAQVIEWLMIRGIL